MLQSFGFWYHAQNEKRSPNNDSCARIVGKKEKREQLHRVTYRDNRDKELCRYKKEVVDTCPWRVYLRHLQLMRFIYD
jgi:hypothetical protein